MEFKHSTMATPGPNNPSSHNNGSSANHHHQQQQQSQHHISTTTLSGGMQGECNGVTEGGRAASSHSAAVKVNVSRG